MHCYGERYEIIATAINSNKFRFLENLKDIGFLNGSRKPWWKSSSGQEKVKGECTTNKSGCGRF